MEWPGLPLGLVLLLMTGDRGATDDGSSGDKRGCAWPWWASRVAAPTASVTSRATEHTTAALYSPCPPLLPRHTPMPLLSLRLAP